MVQRKQLNLATTIFIRDCFPNNDPMKNVVQHLNAQIVIFHTCIFNLIIHEQVIILSEDQRAATTEEES
jgi:hypothetical protein